MYCLIDGHRAIPSGSVKVTLANPQVSDSGEYTYDVSFPLDIDENMEAFGLMGRVDISKSQLSDYDDVKFYAGNKLLIVGTGTVTGITDKELRLQIVGGKSGLNYRLQKENLYIDQLTYPDLSSVFAGWLDYKYVEIPNGSGILTTPYFGSRNKYVCFSICNDNTEEVYNRVIRMKSGDKWYLERPTFQPGLIFVLEGVFQALGYEVLSNVFNAEPWNDLYICSLRRSKTIAGMLPHWKVQTFLDEFRKLMNANYIIDEMNKTVRIVSASRITDGTVQRVDVADDFSMDYDDEGISLSSTDNLRYELQPCAWPYCVDEITPEQMANMNLFQYPTRNDFDRAAASWTDEQKMTRLVFCTDTGYWYYRKDDNDGHLVLRQCAFFNQLTREGNTYDGAATMLKIVPVPMGIYYVDRRKFDEGYTFVGPRFPGPTTDYDTITEQDAQELITVQDILEDGQSPADKDSEDDVMMVCFLGNYTYKAGTPTVMKYMLQELYLISGTTDYRIIGVTTRRSLALAPPVGSNARYIGELHVGTPPVDRTHQMVYRVLMGDTIPSPGSLFLIRGHRYLCSKLELTATSSGIDSVATGYFNEILES